ncbi:hypothetical protein EXJ73_22935 [Pelomonas aquatica]|uniref:Uncharacterized protein n=2 Tax=Pelomonas aquatica TaxID=431058 RepID=A0A9X4LJM0_9BURK|nr:hypothetical protein [Pelomonas aquatica]
MNRFLNALYPLALAAGLAGIAGAALAASRHHPVALLMTLQPLAQCPPAAVFDARIPAGPGRAA